MKRAFCSLMLLLAAVIAVAQIPGQPMMGLHLRPKSSTYKAAVFEKFKNQPWEVGIINLAWPSNPNSFNTSTFETDLTKAAAKGWALVRIGSAPKGTTWLALAGGQDWAAIYCEPAGPSNRLWLAKTTVLNKYAEVERRVALALHLPFNHFGNEFNNERGEGGVCGAYINRYSVVSSSYLTFKKSYWKSYLQSPTDAKYQAAKTQWLTFSPPWTWANWGGNGLGPMPEGTIPARVWDQLLFLMQHTTWNGLSVSGVTLEGLVDQKNELGEPIGINELNSISGTVAAQAFAYTDTCFFNCYGGNCITHNLTPAQLASDYIAKVTSVYNVLHAHPILGSKAVSIMEMQEWLNRIPSASQAPQYRHALYVGANKLTFLKFFGVFCAMETDPTTAGTGLWLSASSGGAIKPLTGTEVDLTGAYGPPQLSLQKNDAVKIAAKQARTLKAAA